MLIDCLYVLPEYRQRKIAINNLYYIMREVRNSMLVISYVIITIPKITWLEAKCLSIGFKLQNNIDSLNSKESESFATLIFDVSSSSSSSLEAFATHLEVLSGNR